MYVLTRRVHAYSGLLLLLFVIMYFASGVLLVHQDRVALGAPEVVSTRTESLAFEPAPGDLGAGGAQALSIHVQERFGLRGQRMDVQRLDEGGWNLRYVRPGTMVRAHVSPDLSDVTITVETRGWAATLIQLHRLHGYGGGFIYDVWAVLYDLVSLSMILFSLTGVFLWYRRTTDRRLGWALLIGSWGFCAGTVVYLMLAP